MDNIQKSIDTYYNSIMKDINASARIVVEGAEDQTYITRIIDWNSREITFHAPLVLGDYIRLVHNHVYPFVIVTKSCIYTTSIEIIDFSRNKQDHFYYKGLITSPLLRNQQRRYFRLQWSEPFRYKIHKSSEWEQASILDISVGGLRMATQNKISRDDSIHIDITLLGTKIILNGVVLEELEKNSANLYVYRVQFHKLSGHRENLLSQLIMRRQRDMRKQK